jgi:regulatory protein
MKITEIKAQVKRAGRFSIFVDGEYSFSLSDSALLEQKIYVGQEVDSADIKRLKQISSDDKLYGNTLRYVAMRPHSEWEIQTYLKRKDATPALADSILNKLRNNNLVDDAAFAKSWIESRRLLKPTSKRKIQLELRAKHISDDNIQKALAEDETDERETLRQLIAKKRTRYPDDLKLMQYLARQGFGYDEIKVCIEQSDVD